MIVCCVPFRLSRLDCKRNLSYVSLHLKNKKRQQSIQFIIVIMHGVYKYRARTCDHESTFLSIGDQHQAKSSLEEQKV